MKSVPSLVLLAALAVSLSACGWGSDPQACAHMSEQKGTSVARKSLKDFLHYAGKTRAPLTGPAGTLDPLKLEHVNDGDLIKRGQSHLLTIRLDGFR